LKTKNLSLTMALDSGG